MALISEESIRQVVEANDIVEVIGNYFPLRKAGTSLRALCPFHREKSPSFHVNPIRQSYHCFGCGAGGDVLRFVREYEQVDFPEAVRRLALRAGIILVEEISSETDRGERARLLALHAAAADWFHLHLMRSRDAASARDYLKNRGLTQTIAKDWKLGYAPDTWDGLLNFLRGEKFSASEIFRGGLTTTREGESDPSKGYDRFRGRLMIPIRNDYGEVIAFSGRVLEADAKTAKYVNSPETPLFTKGRVLFGLDRTKRALIDEQTAVVCEGQIDLITAYEAGIRNVIAPQGTAFTIQQARLLKRFVNTVVLCFDSDTAGETAIDRSLASLFDQELNVKVALPPSGEDPDSLIRKSGPDAFRKLIADAKDVFDFKLERAELRGELNEPKSRIQVARQLTASLVLIPDPILRDAILTKVAGRLGILTSQIIALLPKKVEPTPDDTENKSTQIPLILNQADKMFCIQAILSDEARHWLIDQRIKTPHEFERDFELLPIILDNNVSFSSTSQFSSFIASQPEKIQSVIASLDLDREYSDALERVKRSWLDLTLQRLAEKNQILANKLLLPENKPYQSEILKSQMELRKEILDLQLQLKDISRPISTAKPA